MTIYDIVIFSLYATSDTSTLSVRDPVWIHPVYNFILGCIEHMPLTILYITKSSLSHCNIFDKILNTLQIQIYKDHTNPRRRLSVTN